MLKKITNFLKFITFLMKFRLLLELGSHTIGEFLKFARNFFSSTFQQIFKMLVVGILMIFLLNIIALVVLWVTASPDSKQIIQLTLFNVIKGFIMSHVRNLLQIILQRKRKGILLFLSFKDDSFFFQSKLQFSACVGNFSKKNLMEKNNLNDFSKIYAEIKYDVEDVP